MLGGLAPVAEQAAEELMNGATAEEIAAHAVKVNVYHAMDKLLEYSPGLRERVRRREVQVHGAIYDLSNGHVDFIGQSPNLGRLADSTAPPPPVSARYGSE
uniref:Carbonic anhydrase n=1 Tax=Alexandrium monilatum TaxID=311494 RepID=A0A7S4WGL9_9DINO